MMDEDKKPQDQKKKVQQATHDAEGNEVHTLIQDVDVEPDTKPDKGGKDA